MDKIKSLLFRYDAITIQDFEDLVNSLNVIDIIFDVWSIIVIYR